MKLKLQVAALEATRQIDQRIAKGRQLCMALVNPDFPLADYERKRILWQQQTDLTLAAIFEDVTAVNEIIEEAERKATEELAKRPAILVGRRVDDAEEILLRRKDASRKLEKEISRLEDMRDLVEFSDEPVLAAAQAAIAVLQGLSPEDIATLQESLPDILKQTPRTAETTSKVQAILSKASSGSKALWDKIATPLIVEYAKKTLIGS